MLEDLDLNPPMQDYLSINKTKLSPCDREYDLYTYGPSYNSHSFSYHAILNKCGHNCDGYRKYYKGFPKQLPFNTKCNFDLGTSTFTIFHIRI